MKRRASSGRRRGLPPRVLAWIFGLNLALLVFLVGWYAVQPDTRQREVRRLVENALAGDKRVTVLDVAWDIWQLYYADSAAGRIAAGDKAIVYGGAPRATQPGVRLLVNRAYVVGYSEEHANPLWAAYRVGDLGRIPTTPDRPDRFEVDRRTATRVAPSDYTGSGYDRGHLAPNFAIVTRYGREAQRETFLMSNITPQRHELNAGLWRELEMKIAINYPARYGEVWVLNGPIFGASPKRLKGGVLVPEAFFKIIIDEQDGRLRTLSFIVPQDAPADASPSRYLTSIAEIQRRTGLDFLSELEDVAERDVEQRKAEKVW
jgi:endonuclease G